MKCHVTDDLSFPGRWTGYWQRTLVGLHNGRGSRSAAEWHAWSLSTGRPALRLSQRAVGHEYYAERFADST